MERVLQAKSAIARLSVGRPLASWQVPTDQASRGFCSRLQAGETIALELLKQHFFNVSALLKTGSFSGTL